MDADALARRLIEEMPDAVVVADAEGVICIWNQGAERIFGFSRAEAIGKSLDIITPENLRAHHWEGYRRTMSTGKTKYGAGDLLSVPATHKDGRRISVQFTVLPLSNPDGSLSGIAAVMRDTTKDFDERKALMMELAELRRRSVG